MEQVDTQRMKRVMERLHPPGGPPPPPPPPPPGPAIPPPPPPPPPERRWEAEQLRREEEIAMALRNAMDRSRRCRQELGPWVRASMQRQRHLRSELYLCSGDRSFGKPARRQEGALASLRRGDRLLREAETEYERMSRDERQDRDDRKTYAAYAAQCRRNRQVIRGLVEQIM